MVSESSRSSQSILRCPSAASQLFTQLPEPVCNLRILGIGRHIFELAVTQEYAVLYLTPSGCMISSCLILLTI